MNNIQLILMLLVGVVYVVTYISKKVQEQAAARREKEAQARRRLDALRTGQVSYEEVSPTVMGSSGRPGAPLEHDEATRRLQEMAEKRRQQLEELRRRAMGQGSQGGRPAPAQTMAPPVAMPTQPARQEPVATPPRRQGPGRGNQNPQRRNTQRQPRPSERERTATRARSQEEDLDATEKRARAEALRAAAESREASQAAAVMMSQPGAGRGEGMKGLILPGKMTAAQLRQAIMLREVFGRPVSLRDDAAERDGV